MDDVQYNIYTTLWAFDLAHTWGCFVVVVFLKNFPFNQTFPTRRFSSRKKQTKQTILVQIAAYGIWVEFSHHIVALSLVVFCCFFLVAVLVETGLRVAKL